MMIFIIAILCGGAFFFASSYLLKIVSGMKIESKIYNVIAKQSVNKQFFMPAFFRWTQKLGKQLAKIHHSKFKAYIDKLSLALKFSGAKYAHYDVYQMAAAQCVAGFAAALLCIFIISSNPILILGAALGGFFLPFLSLKEAAAKRSGQILKQLPDAVDLMSIILDAGLDFFGAMSKAASILKGPLADEFNAAISKISLGYERKAALTEMAANCGVDEVVFFAKTVNMALESGSGMSETLKRLAAQIRREQENKAQKKAQEAPVKILIPLILFIFPTIFIVIFGPIVINLIRTGGF
ncbi:MAG: type II secretion system F family protein [Elusimicrobiota bacterium]|jgi:tight adherence protein C|nr:type II secretion system F family protein [Elusimicrobiota bacterium]